MPEVRDRGHQQKGQQTREKENGQKRQPAQQQRRRPGLESEMTPRPKVEKPTHRGCNKLKGKVALITGGDSGIGRAVAVAFAKEGADVAVSYLNEHSDAEETKRMVEKHGRKCVTLAGDIGYESFCRQLIERTVKEFGRLDCLVNNAAEQHPQDSLEQIDREQLERTFRTNVFAMFYLTKAALPHLKKSKGTVINTSSITAYEGNPMLIDYSSTKGAIVAFTRALSKVAVKEGVRVNGVAPGPIWTPLIPSTFPPDKVEEFGANTPMGRPGQPDEVAMCYVFLASDDSSYISGQFLHPNGGKVVNA
jgi:NAD(P)-dependent dehydrogenase (short-subunit alcohol dehydrogenase family)